MIIISLDGVNWEMVQPTLDKGKLPSLSKLISKGTSSIFQTHSFISSGSTWPCIHTGRHPGHHGIFFSHRQFKSGTYNIVKKAAEDIPFKAFWQIVSKNGIPTIAIDLPKAPLVEEFNGMVLNSWGEEAPWYSPSYPRDLKKEIHSKFGRHPLQEFYHHPMKDHASWLKIKDQHLEALNTRFKVANYLMQKQDDWGLFIMAVNELHLAGHLFWHLIDESHPEHDPELRKKLGNIIEELLIIADQKIGDLVNKHPEVPFLILSNNGMTRSGQPVNVMDVILKKMGYMKGIIPDPNKVSRRSHNFIYEAERYLPLGLISFIKEYLPKKWWYRVTRKLMHSSKDWKPSQAFPIPNDVSGAIRINLKGREPEGKVDPSEYDQLCEDIKKDFLAITINEKGIPAVKKVIKIKDSFAGAKTDELADLLIIWNKEEPIISIQGDKIGSINVKYDKRSGSHTDKGIFIFSELIEGGNRPDIIHDLSIYPTVLDYFGIKETEVNSKSLLSNSTLTI